MVPACSLLPSCAGKVMICGSREDGANLVEFAKDNIFPLHYTIESPVACFQLAEVVAAYACGESIPSLKAPTL